MSDIPTPETGRIEGRVAQILNAQELVINRGHTHGVTVGMKFAILADQPLAIVDPETNDELDTIDREKVRVQVTEVREKVAICSTYRIKSIPGGPLHTAMEFSDLFRAPRRVPETFDAKNSSLPPPLHPDDSYVKINDRVVEVPPDTNP